WDHLESFRGGFIFDRNESSVCEVLRKAQSLDVSDWERMSWSSRYYVEQQLDPVKLGDRIWQALMRHDLNNAPQKLAEGSSHE
ncbi:MAG: glycosyltransferase family 4 protein, partial [Methylococcaceae bacterium]